MHCLHNSHVPLDFPGASTKVNCESCFLSGVCSPAFHIGFHTKTQPEVLFCKELASEWCIQTSATFSTQIDTPPTIIVLRRMKARTAKEYHALSLLHFPARCSQPSPWFGSFSQNLAVRNANLCKQKLLTAPFIFATSIFLQKSQLKSALQTSPVGLSVTSTCLYPEATLAVNLKMSENRAKIKRKQSTLPWMNFTIPSMATLTRHHKTCLRMYRNQFVQGENYGLLLQCSDKTLSPERCVYISLLSCNLCSPYSKKIPELDTPPRVKWMEALPTNKTGNYASLPINSNSWEV